MSDTDAEACKLTPCGNPLRAATGRSQASASVSPTAVADGPHRERSASELAGVSVPQGVEPAQPAGPAGGPVARSRSGPASVGREERALSSLDTTSITRPQSRREVGATKGQKHV